MPSLHIIIGIPKNRRHNHACAVLGTGLLCVPLAYAGGVVVGHNHDLLGWAVHLAQLAGHGH